MEWLVSRSLNLGYLALLLVASPWILWNRLVHGKYREGFREKVLGDLRLSQRVDASPDNGRPLWLHAVSVGEVLLLKPLIADWIRFYPQVPVVLTVTTQTGRGVAEKMIRDLGAKQIEVRYFPLDFSWSVNRAIRQLQPLAIVLVELEIWPNLVLAARQQAVPVMVINGRLSERSFRGYHRFVGFFRWLLKEISCVGAQTKEYAARFEKLGVPASRVVVTGNLKYDRIETCRQNPRTIALREHFGFHSKDIVWIAGSTQHPEEALAIDAWLSLRKEFPCLQLMIVPRHRERFEEVAQLILAKGCQPLRRTSPTPHNSPHNELPPIRLLDTLGELGAAWGLADLAFVGGSLTNRGGQNMIEPAGYGAALFFGPNTQNFKQTVDLLLANQAASVVSSGADLATFVRKLLENPQQRILQGQAAQQLVLDQSGAVEKTLELITTHSKILKTGSAGGLGNLGAGVIHDHAA
ncbi:Three-deoxy-D-manno-octulosonic-acid transferase domain protein [Planctopirus limnophila DSM 3776]|uniref:3-deoxy-D-manno-octulosonic acid transferase n=1 Tax=Planctopirus limnophila (strain ATCC 43296 / DSM 3776 / IFAM 1008 / Mu 290) TaxID=521674 RepID=D5SP48_PLAL2|nr:3-deoxy-D-manno-octulosonic acid transferase [Planctopirus limnophila]ADG68192.1 Three-deoxy-D-manno-octulosonic-acid transferase domain protein [Planctopirus limnophila DSM 3776]